MTILCEQDQWYDVMVPFWLNNVSPVTWPWPRVMFWSYFPLAHKQKTAIIALYFSSVLVFSTVLLCSSVLLYGIVLLCSSVLYCRGLLLSNVDQFTTSQYSEVYLSESHRGVIYKSSRAICGNHSEKLPEIQPETKPATWPEICSRYPTSPVSIPTSQGLIVFWVIPS